MYLFKPEVVCDHLVSNGICINYDAWFFHGESIYVATSSRATNSDVKDLNNKCVEPIVTLATSNRTKAYLFEQEVGRDHLVSLLVQQINSQVVITL